MKKGFKITESKEYWLALEEVDGWVSADVKWDGCIHLRHYANEPLHQEGRNTDCDDYIHICDIDDFIAELQEIKRLAKEHYGDFWPNV